MTEFDKLNHVRVKIDNLINEFVSGQKEDESDEDIVSVKDLEDTKTTKNTEGGACRIM